MSLKCSVKRILVFLRLVWREDFMGDPISIRTAWEVATIFYPLSRCEHVKGGDD